MQSQYKSSGFAPGIKKQNNYKNSRYWNLNQQLEDARKMIQQENNFVGSGKPQASINQLDLLSAGKSLIVQNQKYMSKRVKQNYTGTSIQRPESKQLNKPSSFAYTGMSLRNSLCVKNNNTKENQINQSKKVGNMIRNCGSS